MTSMRRYRLTPNELTLWLRYIEHQIGFVLPSSQVGWVKGVIERHLTQSAMSSTDLLEAISEDPHRYHALFDDILIPRTQFFRHLPTFGFIQAYTQAWHQHVMVPDVHDSLRPTRDFAKFSAWSVGCSTGQETISMALTLASALGIHYPFEVYGSDFHQQSLAQARQGRYDMAEWAYIPARYHEWLALDDNKYIQVMPELMQHVHYFSKNLVQYMQPMPLQKGQCQVIVCKNVLIYFRQFEQRDIVSYLAEYLAEDGILLLGAGELTQFNHALLQRIAIPEINAFCHIHAPKWLLALVDAYRGEA